MLSALLVLFCVAVTHAGRSPNADYVEELIRNNKFGRISDSVVEDALLDVPDLAAKYRYPLEEHTVVTPDGYILQMHRIPYGRDNNNEPGDKPVVFVMHGLWGSSADFILMGPGSGLAYLLAEEGYDVWMGNARGNYYSRRHEWLRPDALLNTAFWNFSWDEIGHIDLPSMIDYTLEYTGKQQLHYIGFSQGTTSFYVMGSLRPEYNDKIISMHALAPIAYMAHVPNLLLRALAPFATQIADVTNLLGIGELLSHSAFYTWAGQTLCTDEAVFQPVCSNILFLLSGYSPDQLNTTMLPVIFGHFPAGSSIRQFTHYLQGISQKGFRRYNFGLLRNQNIYGSISPPDYNLGKITAPVFLYYSENDALSGVLDVERLYNELPFAEKFLNADSNYGHIDYLYGINATSLVYDYVINKITSLENQNK
ncbi:lipase 3-like isoform X2 [Leptidea sinapis]|uniref:lipase 3-like isoform X2 n=1 Tax=Leptidea sinapis TaxID=189913 RepID=UPI0021C4944E|nr:lipase 3-like isoform X2 [Leptidea sinapis]